MLGLNVQAAVQFFKSDDSQQDITKFMAFVEEYYRDEKTHSSQISALLSRHFSAEMSSPNHDQMLFDYIQNPGKLFQYQDARRVTAVNFNEDTKRLARNYVLCMALNELVKDEKNSEHGEKFKAIFTASGMAKYLGDHVVKVQKMGNEATALERQAGNIAAKRDDERSALTGFMVFILMMGGGTLYLSTKLPDNQIDNTTRFLIVCVFVALFFMFKRGRSNNYQIDTDRLAEVADQKRGKETAMRGLQGQLEAVNAGIAKELTTLLAANVSNDANTAAVLGAAGDSTSPVFRGVPSAATTSPAAAPPATTPASTAPTHHKVN